MVALPEASPLLLLLPVALGGGVDLFLTILVVLLSMEPGWTGAPETLRWAVYGVVTALYLTEVWMEMNPLRALLWHTAQRLIRPLGVVLLGWLLMDSMPARVLVPGLVVAGVAGSMAHALSWGLKLQGFLLPTRRVSPMTLGMAEDTLTLGILVLAMEFPLPGTLLAGGILILGTLAGPSFLNVTRLGHSLALERVWGIVSPPGWHASPDLSPWLRKAMKGQDLDGIRGLPALGRGFSDFRGSRKGWLVEIGAARFFAFRGLWGPRVIPLAGVRAGPAEASEIHTTLPLESLDGSNPALFLQKTAPVPESHKW